MIGAGTVEMDECERRRLPAAVRPLFRDGGGARTLSVELPAGAVVWPDPTYLRFPSAARGRPAFWLSEAPATGALYARLRADHPHSGLWPVLLEESVQPWSVGQIAPDAAEEVDNYSVGAFMEEVWADWIARAAEDQIEILDPFGPHCPGPAEPGEPRADPGAVADWYAATLAEQGMPVGLAAVDRGADALAVMGWQGALHHNEWNVPLAAVVRSWEDRFGARLVCMGFNTMELSVAAPPMTAQHAVHVAAEHWAFCPDAIIQGAGTLLDYAEQLCGRHTWSFWWD
ncbi:hypothetical protein Sme01_51200 [Sphaerisporangium melleum]|uniref:DUF4253 domain-containing protein n=1 Tax=Sphaerisporangium melleum TaxID=321316 RepID=A0A917QYA1_9ACTN|nr:DUF4253 domain-containing protein [Sphaerisporangium melleum]GGK75551.1 hypothetical protein GCM10007964_17960 [Sphaerisporangium melleum]GII72644.1 hypothetical protein Sme01_51200 [Sphaerisporangium melleum]